MTNQIEGLRRRLLEVLRERLSELEDDETRQANWQKINWELLERDLCPRCHKPSFRFRDGLCLPCGEKLMMEFDLKERAKYRFLRLARAHNLRVEKRTRQPIREPAVLPAQGSAKTVTECDYLYSYKQIKALAVQHKLPSRLTTKSAMCEELLRLGAL